MKPESFRFEVAGLSDVGRIRSLNEDGVAVDSKHGFAMVTDGMGGHRAGDLASRLALESMTSRLRSRSAEAFSAQWVRDSITSANTLIHNASLHESQRKGMGSTLAMVLFQDQQALLAHVGDSRIYRLRNGLLELLTRDDSVLNDQVEMGLIGTEDAGDSHNRHFVTQALGMGEQVEVHLREEDLRDGDVYLLCTDGLNDLVSGSDISLIIDALKTNLPLTASHLVQLANDSGGYDNVTVALVRVLGKASLAKQRGWLARIFGRLAH